MTRMVQLYFTQHTQKGAPLAVVRYTLFDVDDKPVDVQQHVYRDNKKGWNSFEEQVLAALESNVDISILSTQSITDFERLDAYLSSIGYYLNSDS